MGMFIESDFVLKPNDKGTQWVLVNDLVYKISDSFLITVPAGFSTDLASTPKAIWSILPPWGDYSKAAVVHDYCYHYLNKYISRKEADKLLNDMMVSLRVSLWKRIAIYYGVKIFGGIRWQQLKSKAK